MIIRLTAHAGSTDIVVVHAGPELASFMGDFGPARWQSASKAYWLEATHLDAFGRHANRAGHTIVDDRKSAGGAEKFTGPLPECAECGQSASRSAALALVRCPNCGAPWRPVVAPTAAQGNVTQRGECSACGRTQIGAFRYCGRCGGPMVFVVTGARPASVPRPVLVEPVLFGDVAGEVVDDVRKRAAGDR